MQTPNADSDKITIGGVDYTFCITPYGLMKADDMGIDVLSEFDKMRSDQASGGLSPIKAMKTFSKLVWVGIVTNHPDVTLEQVQRAMGSFAELAAYSDLIGRHMARLMNGAEPGEAKAPKAGRKAK